jgi:site-specific recombinase XerD
MNIPQIGEERLAGLTTTDVAIPPDASLSSSSTNLCDLRDLPLDQNPAAVYLARLTPGGQRTMGEALNIIASMLTGGQANALTCHWSALRFQHTSAIRARLAAAYKPATANRMLCALRGTLKMAWRLEQMSAEEYHRAADIQGVRGETVPTGRELRAGEIAALITACTRDPSPAGARDAAIISLMYSIGLRREEVVALDVQNYDRENGRLLIRGKGNKERNAYPEEGASDALADWLAVRVTESGPMFVPINKVGKMTNRRLTNQAIYNMLRKRALEAAVKGFSPHDLRRTFVSDLLDAGADIATVAKMAGHANVQTTARYDRRPEEARRKAGRLLHVPYVRKDRNR